MGNSFRSVGFFSAIANSKVELLRLFLNFFGLLFEGLESGVIITIL